MNEPRVDEQMKREYQAMFRAAVEEARKYSSSLENREDIGGPGHPYHRWAPKIFRFYLENRPSKVASDAAKNALNLWGLVDGVSGEVEKAVAQIDDGEGIWGNVVAQFLFRAFYRDGREGDGVALVEDLIRCGAPGTPMLFGVANVWMEEGEKEKARRMFERIIALNETQWHVELLFARGCLHEMENLNEGQEAPLFSTVDLEGNHVELVDYRGKVVVLHFWSTTCGACGGLSHWRDLLGKYPEGELALIGFSKDYDVEAARSAVRTEGIDWPQVCEGKGWADSVFHLYNVRGVPWTYVIDREGRIVCKRKRGEELEKTLDGLLPQNALSGGDSPRTTRPGISG